MVDVHPPAAPYRGRFAPTPSGPLHLGSLLTALASYLQARAAGGAWLLRLDDLDAPRCRPQAASRILCQLEAHGLTWDESPRYQSEHLEAYAAALDALRERAPLYACACTRAELARRSHPGPDGPVYDGCCRARHLVEPGRALRVAVGAGRVGLDDPWQGSIERDLAGEVGDFVVRRSDGRIGYQLACIVDEQAQAITEVVRGADLVGSTLRQRWLQEILGLATPACRHLPVLLAATGGKLSKQNHAPAVLPDQAGANLDRCLALLGQGPPPQGARWPVSELIDWAVAHWDPQRVPRLAALQVV